MSESVCQNCGGSNPSWRTDSDRWNLAAPREVIWCPSCFVRAHQDASGLTCTWELRPVTPFRGLE